MAPQVSVQEPTEKQELSWVEAADVSKQEESVDDEEEFSPKEQKRIIRHLDRRLVMTTGIMFCFSLMDRSNLGAASIAGMTKDLNLIQYRYVSIFLVSSDIAVHKYLRTVKSLS